jgi:Predicted periplasmic solute-binding protein
VAPARDERALYFVARGDGSHLFARTYPEHLENIRRAQVLRADAAAEADSLRALDSLARH